MRSRFTFGVLHTVVQHALCAQHSGHVLDGGPEAVWCIVARAFVVAIVIVEFLAISAAQSSLDERGLLHGRCVEGVPLFQTRGRVPPSADYRTGFLDDRIVVIGHLQVIKVIF